MAIYRLRGNNYWLWTVFWSGTGLLIMTLQLCRRCGFSTDYARIKFMTTSGEYRTILECGAVTDNRWLPPHLRLDQKSYLDSPDAVVCEPPAYDLSVTDKELMVALVDVLPEEKKADLAGTWFGMFNTRTIAVSMDDHERVIKRRIGVSTQPEQQAQADAAVNAMLSEAAAQAAAAGGGGGVGGGPPPPRAGEGALSYSTSAAPPPPPFKKPTSGFTHY